MNAAQLSRKLDAARQELADLEGDLPKLEKMLTDARAQKNGKPRQELLARRGSLRAAVDEQRADIREQQKLVEQLQREHEAVAEEEAFRDFVKWTQEKNAEGLELFLQGVALIEAARGPLNEVYHAIRSHHRAFKTAPTPLIAGHEHEVRTLPAPLRAPTFRSLLKEVKPEAVARSFRGVKAYDEILRRHGYQ